MSIFIQSLFHIILTMSLTSSVVIFIVLFIRFFFKKLPKVFSYALWFLVLFRLLCPVTIESSVSIFNLLAKGNNTNTVSVMEPVPYTIGYQVTPQVNHIPPVTASVNQSLPPETPQASINPMQFLVFLTKLFWCIGMAFMLLMGLYSALRLKLTLHTACRIKDNIYCSEALTSPFVYGIISPKIYLPMNLSEAEKEYIILHEQTHLKRFDHFTKLLWHIALCIHWFNPLVWISFRLMERDMEMSCDEAVIKVMGEEIKADYSHSLLQMSFRQKSFKTSIMNPLAFGEISLKTRIKNVLSYKRPVLWITSVSVTIILIIAVTLLTNPKGDDKKDVNNTTKEPSEYNQNSSNGTEPDNISQNNPSQNTENNQNILKINTSNTYQVTSVNKPEGKTLENTSSVLLTNETVTYLDLLTIRLFASSSYNPGTDAELMDRYYRITATSDESTSSAYYIYVMDGNPYMQLGKLGSPMPLSLKEYIIISYMLQPNLHTAQIVEDNLESMLSSPLPYSNTDLFLQKIIENNSMEYDNIIKYGDVSLSYMLTCFQNGEGNTLKGRLMMQLCNEILGKRSYNTTNNPPPTEWFQTLSILPATSLPDYSYEGDNPILKLLYESEVQMRTNKDLGFLILAPYIWDYYEEGSKIKVFATIYYSYFNLYGGLNLSVNNSQIIPIAVTYAKKSDGNYYQENYYEAGDGSNFNTSIRDFCTTPVSNKDIPGLADKIIKNSSDNTALTEIMDANLKEHLSKYGFEYVNIEY